MGNFFKIVLKISSWSHFKDNLILNKYSKVCIPVKLIFSEFCTSVIFDMTSSRVRCLKSSDQKQMVLMYTLFMGHGGCFNKYINI